MNIYKDRVEEILSSMENQMDKDRLTKSMLEAGKDAAACNMINAIVKDEVEDPKQACIDMQKRIKPMFRKLVMKPWLKRQAEDI